MKRRTREENLPCGYGSPHGFGCGEPIDTTLDRRHPMSFTADHITPLAHGGHLLGPLVPMHLSCNSRKGDNLPTEIWEAS
ncbi:HNH endonuclease [Microbacterium hominis]|nr:HNH endonuclease [Microbacterium hominis]